MKLLVNIAAVALAQAGIAHAESSRADFARRIVGQWEGPRHIRVFYPDGGFSLDPQPGDKPLGTWKLAGDQLKTQFHEDPVPVVERIVKITDTEMITTYRGRRWTYKRVR